MLKDWEINKLEDLGPLVQAVVEELINKKTDTKATVLALHGELGAGKTTFMQLLAKALSVTEVVTSPTFVVMKNYALEAQPWQQLIHIDAYRIEDLDEMRPLGFAEILQNSDNLICIEWAEKISDLLPMETCHINFFIKGEARKVTING